MNLIPKIAITGPESTGKSTLCKSLAASFNSLWVPEYARTYCEGMNLEYKLRDIENIAKGQQELEEVYLKKASKVLFCDTDFVVLKIWAEHAFGECPAWIDNAIRTNDYRHFLLCNTDVEWEYDPLREHPHLREELFEKYLAVMTDYNLPFTVIKGKGEERFEMAKEIVEKILLEA